jgi:hypothetical protein
MDELRNEIWDYLFRADGSKSIDEIAISVNQDGETIVRAIDHDWFVVVDDRVSIAYGT